MTGKLLSAFLLVTCLTVAAQAETITLSLPDVEASVGGKFDVIVNVDGAKNLVAWQFAVVHDPDVLTVTQVEAGSVTEGGLLESNFETAGRTWIAGVRIQPVSTVGDMLRITYEVVGEAGQTSPLTIEDTRAWQANETEVLVETKSGTFAVAPPSGVGSLGLLVLIGVVIAGCVLGAIMWFRRRGKAAPTAPPPEPDEHHELHEHAPHIPSDGKIHIQCPNCGRALVAPPEAAGHKAKCIKCGAKMTIPPMAKTTV